MSTRFVCILAASRTGSSHLIKLLHDCRELNVKGELFHVDNIARLTKSDKAKLQEASSGVIADRKTLCEWRRRHPRRTLDVLYDSGNRRSKCAALAGRGGNRPSVEWTTSTAVRIVHLMGP